ncbi:hypothetical protein BFJ66_g17338 [Fusarium oxysporum f. sp. cepae]|uniref:Uncharacterized protein n=1 Tax=Fusarium oxysporum f. sp. cepae TaxID=396571 RepID=A0A3L6MR58_FUSOX|nr:hypothetical protein BFJ65_g18558 [Fusarium oxysporum f. sp. cepae]RKK23845.1 hypothetical protein BFJ66_g17338 [Fusarium oxysporum f. sp. cepae]
MADPVGAEIVVEPDTPLFDAKATESGGEAHEQSPRHRATIRGHYERNEKKHPTDDAGHTD